MKEIPVIDFRSETERLFETGRLQSNSGDGNLGGIWDAVGRIGAAGVQLLPSLFGGGSGSGTGQARGLAAINTFGQQAIQTLQQILQQLRSQQLSLQDALQNAQRIAGALSDPQYVYQAQRGADAEALRNFKAQAEQLLSQIQSSGVAAQTQTPVNPAGVPTATTPPSSLAGLSLSPTMLLVFGGLAALLVLKK